ncbi:rhomboid-like protein [Actinocatenispora sera]|uniref:Uncharacterized protein n=1 Tax=Actinocatenispora sera TaxID=390989 RepID=A0A810L648_9ACTN|nr:rhomboid-like protein [Actinocatenispora sera]BCJ30974.1 hypothetical protein Asera_50820 [Actinocatenispora sera]
MPQNPPRWARVIRTMRRALPGPRETPVTVGYLLALLAGVILLRALSADDATRLLAASSTNVVELTSHPVRALIGSAVWLPDGAWLPYAVGFAVTLAPLERRLGGLRALALVGGGHVGVSLATEAGVAVAVHTGAMPAAALSRLDVGASYLLLTALGAVLGLLPRTLRWPILGLAAAAAGGALAVAADLTSLGHLLCLFVGVGFWPVLARRGLVGTLWPGRLPWTPAARLGTRQLAPHPLATRRFVPGRHGAVAERREAGRAARRDGPARAATAGRAWRRPTLPAGRHRAVGQAGDSRITSPGASASRSTAEPPLTARVTWSAESR